MCFIISAVGILTFLTLNVLNNTMKMQKTLIFQHFSISPIHFNVKNKMASSRQADGEYLPCISVHNYITNTKTMYGYSSSALRISTFPLEEYVHGCSFLTSIDCNTTITNEYMEKLRTYNFRCPLISGLGSTERN